MKDRYPANVYRSGAPYRKLPPLACVSFFASSAATADKFRTTGELDGYSVVLSVGSLGFVREGVRLTKAPTAVIDFSGEFATFLDAGNATRSALHAAESCVDCE